jgi:hypothetical protein
MTYSDRDRPPVDGQADIFADPDEVRFGLGDTAPQNKRFFCSSI